MTAITLDLHSVVDLTDEQFYQLCQANPDLKLERTATGEIVMSPPTGWGTGKRNSKLTQRLSNWAENDGTGVTFDSSSGFKLPNGANRSPDAAWVKQERIDALNPDPDKFLPLAFDFAVELMSASDDLETTQAKMQEYCDNGVRLGWLIDPKNQRVEIYRQGQPVEILHSPVTLSGEDVLPGFVLDLQDIL
ncbi:Uma2 family endonuclease [Gloeocapsopsis dulcis]|uniref:Putative restriction endonuclease domain-containing protein n=1 Tax=Gloeocapsopsis dulcis AAB1 = 1H9 TaxID=1433147 RepID=A0A6N8FTC8_9CHRO|nr:Uma2 family endonuclease [Gloeocapsopsis dulcis]MUL35575.1 hypothetical protein [Gloeocapsopsis dulcis AAB1 = 1H9]WNN87521.1 Uma2 family endonuclease [Gloeocapsopsis dulcis]